MHRSSRCRAVYIKHYDLDIKLIYRDEQSLNRHILKHYKNMHLQRAIDGVRCQQQGSCSCFGTTFAHTDLAILSTC